ncbi:hypothetical protein [Sphingomonas sp. 1185]
MTEPAGPKPDSSPGAFNTMGSQVLTGSLETSGSPSASDDP